MSVDGRGFDRLPSPAQLWAARETRISIKAIEFEARIRSAIASKMVLGDSGMCLAREFRPRLNERYSQSVSSLTQQEDDAREVHEELPSASERAEAWSIARRHVLSAVREAGWDADLDKSTWELVWWPKGTVRP